MPFDPEHPQNTALVRALAGDAPPCAPPQTHDDPYYGAGCHPDVVARVWDQLGAPFDDASRVLVYGRPALMEPASGVVVALAYGTEYVLRVPHACIAAACALGCRRERRWSGGGTTNIEQLLGRGWLFGAFLDDELAWLEASYAAARKARATSAPGKRERPRHG